MSHQSLIYDGTKIEESEEKSKEHENLQDEESDDDPSKDLFLVYVYNLPPWIKWRDLKKFLINFIEDSTILHIQIWPNQFQYDSLVFYNGIISVNSIESSFQIYETLNNYDWNGYLLTVNLSENNDPGLPPPSPLGAISSQMMNYGTTPMNSGSNSQYIPQIPQQVSQGYQSVPPQGSQPQYYNFVPTYYPYQQQQCQPQHYLQPAATILSPPPTAHEIQHPSMQFQYQLTSPIDTYGHSRALSSTSSTPMTSHAYPTMVSSTPVYNSPRLQPPRQLTLRQLNYQDITNITDTPPDRTRLFIGNIPFESDWKDVKDFLRRAVGDSIVRVEIPRNENGSKGFGVAIFNSASEAKRAIDSCNGAMFQGRPLTVRYDKFPKPVRDTSTMTTTTTSSTIVKPDDTVIKLPIKLGIQVGNDSTLSNSPEVSFEDGDFAREARNLVESLSLNN